MTSIRSFHLLLAVPIMLSSCGDDPKLVEKKEKQRAEIVRLKGELAYIEEKLKSLPPDVSEELEEARKVSQKQSAEVEGLEKEVAKLESRKQSLQQEFDAYKLKYPIK